MKINYQYIFIGLLILFFILYLYCNCNCGKTIEYYTDDEYYTEISNTNLEAHPETEGLLDKYYTEIKY